VEVAVRTAQPVLHSVPDRKMPFMQALSRKWIFLVLGTAAVSLACALASLFFARAHLLEAGGWVQHTSDVQLSIAACRIDVHEAQLEAPHSFASLSEAREAA